MLGGVEQPCVSDDWMAAEEKAHGEPCPRREWPDEDGPLLHQLVNLGASGDSSALFAALLDTEYPMPGAREERRRVLRFIFAAYGDETVRLSLWPHTGR